MSIPVLAALDIRGSGTLRSAAIPFTDGDSARIVTISDANVLAGSVITGSIKRPGTPATVTSRIQKKDASLASAASMPITLDALPSSGNTLLVAVGGNGGFLSGVSGGGVISWAHSVRTGTFDDCELWYGVVGPTPSANVLITPPSAERIVSKTEEWFGQLTPDQSHSATATSTTIDPGSITPTTNGQLVMAVGVAFQTISAGPTNGFTDEGTVASASFSMGVASLLQTSAAAADTAWTIPSSGWDAGITSFKVSLLGAGPSYEYIYIWNVIDVRNGSFDVLIAATGMGFEEPDIAPNETPTLVYLIG